MPEHRDGRDQATWLRVAVAGLVGCLLLYGVWKSADWFLASLPTTIR